MIWFLERESDLVICEIRQPENEPEVYEFEIAPSRGPAETRRFTSAGELIDQYLRAQKTLKAQGWHPRLGDMSMIQ
jgi:hypothetical protein